MGHRYEEHQQRETPTALAIRFVEAQREKREASLSPEKRKQQAEYHDVLDKFQTAIFSGIAKAAANGEREFFPGKLSGVHEEIDRIFGGPLASPSREMMDTWLQQKDLKHVFHADPGGWTISW